MQWTRTLARVSHAKHLRMPKDGLTWRGLFPWVKHVAAPPRCFLSPCTGPCAPRFFGHNTGAAFGDRSEESERCPRAVFPARHPPRVAGSQDLRPALVALRKHCLSLQCGVSG